MDISLESWNTQDTIHISNDAQDFGTAKYGYDTLVHLKRGDKIPTESDTETSCGADPEGKMIQRLPYLGIFSIYCYQTQTLISMPTSAC